MENFNLMRIYKYVFIDIKNVTFDIKKIKIP